MKISSTSERLKELMSKRHLRQVDILNLTKPFCEQYNVKMNKSDISQYVAGKNEPSQDKLVVLGMALDVSEAWLIGYDVPEERHALEDEDIANVFVQDSLEDIIDSMEAFSPKEKTYFKKYLQLIEINRLKADKYVDQLLSIQDMEADLVLQAAHERTDIKVTKEMKKHDDDIMNDDSEWE